MIHCHCKAGCGCFKRFYKLFIVHPVTLSSTHDVFWLLFSRCDTALYENYNPQKNHLLLQQTECDWKPIIVPVTEGNGKFPPLSHFLTLWNVKGQTGPLRVETISGWGPDKPSRHHDTPSVERQRRSLRLIYLWAQVCSIWQVMFSVEETQCGAVCFTKQ